MRKIFGFMLGAFTGGLLGAAAALLLTPVTGNELRSEVISRVRMVQKELINARDEKRAELEAQLQALRAPKA
jgi:gas vesicle protein